MYVFMYIRTYVCVNLPFCGVLQNMSSWVLYNMAALYWRIKGDAPSAIECVRRALFFCTW